MDKPSKILIIGQTPPPYGGQALMTQSLIEADFEKVEKYHVRMNFSKHADSIGKFSFHKIIHTLEILWEAIRMRRVKNASTLYYMPVGNAMVPFMRDLMVLSLLRFFFKKTIFHFHAAGISLYVDSLPGFVKRLGLYIYRKPDLAIQNSSLNPPDGSYFQAKEVRIIPNGIVDQAGPYLPFDRKSKDKVHILFVGLIKISKGVLDMLKAAKRLKGEGLRFQMSFVGKFYSEETEAELKNFVQENELGSYVDFPGVKVGNEKWQYFLQADLFCFPSFFESESFGNVILEAMMFGLPVIGSNWRGIPSIIREGETGFIVPPKTPEVLAEKLALLIKDYDLRKRMGVAGRQSYLENYQLSTYLEQIENSLASI
ncbi:MAG: glycosyltransferase family 4 protein [Bacteroidota bacterium]